MRASIRIRAFWATLVILLTATWIQSVDAYQAAINQDDELRQTCSGMWAGKDTKIDRESRR